jgi:hypothetical protein
VARANLRDAARAFLNTSGVHANSSANVKLRHPYSEPGFPRTLPVRLGSRDDLRGVALGIAPQDK